MPLRSLPSETLTPLCTQTVATAGGDTQSQPDVNPCDPADTGTFTMTPKRSVFHVNVNGDGDLWVSSTTNGTATFVPDNPGNVSATGTFANWFGVQLNLPRGRPRDTYPQWGDPVLRQDARYLQRLTARQPPSSQTRSIDQPATAPSGRGRRRFGRLRTG